MTQASIAEAKNNLPRLVQQAEAGEPVSITRRGQPVAVLLSAVAYQRLLSPRPVLGDFLRDWRQQMRDAATGFPDDDTFAGLRDNHPGRPADLE